MLCMSPFNGIDENYTKLHQFEDSATARDNSQLHHLREFLPCPLHWVYVPLIGLPEE